MKRAATLYLGSLGLSALMLLGGAPTRAESGTIQSLRGVTPMSETSAPPDIKQQNTNSGRFNRAYRQQPPLVPHKIAKYQVNLKVNQCIRCHDWPHNVEENAPKISETHYIDRDGVALDHVARNRWFCTQCHVPQANARELVTNKFRSSADVD